MKPSDQRQVFKDIKNLKESVMELGKGIDYSDEIKKIKKDIKSLKKKVDELSNIPKKAHAVKEAEKPEESKPEE